MRAGPGELPSPLAAGHPSSIRQATRRHVAAAGNLKNRGASLVPFFCPGCCCPPPGPLACWTCWSRIGSRLSGSGGRARPPVASCSVGREQRRAVAGRAIWVRSAGAPRAIFRSSRRTSNEWACWVCTHGEPKGASGQPTCLDLVIPLLLLVVFPNKVDDLIRVEGTALLDRSGALEQRRGARGLEEGRRKWRGGLSWPGNGLTLRRLLLGRYSGSSSFSAATAAAVAAAAPARALLPKSVRDLVLLPPTAAGAARRSNDGSVEMLDHIPRGQDRARAQSNRAAAEGAVPK